MNSPTLHLSRDVCSARKGDREAFARVVASTQRMITSIALAITRDLSVSEDIAQETFLIAWQRLAMLRDPESLLPWLREVARNRSIDHVRHARHKEISSPDVDAHAMEEGNDPLTFFAREQDRCRLSHALAAVPDDCREVLLLYYREAQSTRDVADLLGLSDAAVRKRLQRARSALRDRLDATAEAAKRTTPGVAFTTTVLAGIGKAPGVSAAGVGAAGKFAGKATLGVVGALFAALALVGTALWWELRRDLARARSELERRQAYRFAIIHGALMSSFIGALAWSRVAGWSGAEILLVSVAFSAPVAVLAVARLRQRAGYRRTPPN